MKDPRYTMLGYRIKREHKTAWSLFIAIIFWGLCGVGGYYLAKHYTDDFKSSEWVDKLKGFRSK